MCPEAYVRFHTRLRPDLLKASWRHVAFLLLAALRGFRARRGARWRGPCAHERYGQALSRAGFIDPGTALVSRDR